MTCPLLWAAMVRSKVRIYFCRTTT